jgi:SAM-dependent methyltransferase
LTLLQMQLSNLPPGRASKMGSYLGKHAEYYDIFYQDKPYVEEASFVANCLNHYCRRECKDLLELACGTGRHAFELEKSGYKIVAVDYSADLLNVARHKAKESNSLVEFVHQDMRTLDLSGRAFDAIYSLFDSIGYVQTNQAMSLILDGVRKHLRSQGIFIFEFWHAAAMIKNYEPVRERHWQTADGEIVRVSSTRLNIPLQLAEVSYSIDEIVGGKTSHLEETQVNRYFLVQEMAFFLEENGFKVLDFLPAYVDTKVIDENTWHILAIAEKGNK